MSLEKISNGSVVFMHWIQDFETMLQNAKTQKNPAQFFYQNKARTTLFMLEALAKMYRKMHNKKRFENMLDVFKMLEDSLGMIDFYDYFINEFKTNKKISKEIVAVLQNNLTSGFEKLNKILSELFYKNDNVIATIKNKIATADWVEDEALFTKAIQDFYKKEIEKVNSFAKELIDNFDDIETDVHELRRKLRWLSIYPQALLGKIQLKPDLKTVAKYAKYLTAEIIKSPYNKMPLKGKLKSVVLLNKNNFFALSFTINALGKLKDEGLCYKIYELGLMKTAKQSPPEAKKYTAILFGVNADFEERILNEANNILKQFVKDNILNTLVAR
jgi:hypothetical protein